MGRRGSVAPDSTRLVLLGLLARYGPKHGYEVRALIEAQNLTVIADVQYGSIYAGLKRLSRDGLVAEAGRSRTGNRPERVAYDITEDGRKQLRQMLRDALLDATQPERPVDLALHFSGMLPTEDLLDLLHARLEGLRRFGQAVDAAEMATPHDHPGVRALIADISAHFREVNLAEVRWTERVLRRVQDEGGYPTPGRTLE